MKLEQTETGFTLFLNNRAVLNHSDASPAIFIGSGQERMDMYRGNF